VAAYSASYFFFARTDLRRVALPVAPGPGITSISPTRSDCIPAK